jgi:hypothetical protein
MSELLTYGSVGVVGYNPGGNFRGRPASTWKGTPTSYQPFEVAGEMATSITSRGGAGAPLSGRSICGTKEREAACSLPGMVSAFVVAGTTKDKKETIHD